MKEKNKYGFSTLAVHAGEYPDLREGSAANVVAPLHLSTTYAWRTPTCPASEFEYSRSHNPTRKAYENKLAAIEYARYAVAFSSGMAAESAVMQALLRPGDHVVAFDDLYGGTRRLLDEVFPGLSVTYTDLSLPGKLEEALREETRMVWIESPTNPLMKICDIRETVRVAHSRGVMVVVDNTFLSPYFQNPLLLGADLVIHSSTKYIGGHSDVLGGAVVTSDEELHRKVRDIQNNVGAVLSPFDCYLNIRGIKTLALRMERHQSNAMAIARFLESHPATGRVLYPGLESHPQHEIIKRQSSGYGGMVSFEINGNREHAAAVLERLRLFTIAESLGGVESLIELPATMTHVSVDPKVREEIGITDNLVRMSVGIEEVQDLITDLEQALG